MYAYGAAAYGYAMSHPRPRIANVVNFIRTVEPRLEMDLVEPVARQIELLTQHHLPATWLLQHDALLQGPYVSMMRRVPAGHEVGGWFEVVQSLVDRAGLEWRGRYSWDWHANVGFSIGYTPAEREKLIDVYMADFRERFGRYPASVGSWMIDAHTLGYMHDRYGLVGSCNCKDQWGTDGYTLWGGYWNQAYYPSRRNMFIPAQTADEQINVPIFRMLGSDPIYQYDADFYDDGATGQTTRSQGVVTLEPVCREGGGSPPWVRWFFSAMTTGPTPAFAYAQAGQENSFGWPRMKAGFTDQVALLADLAAREAWRVETLETSARWFRARFPLTPSASVVAMEDWKNEGRRSVWFHSRFYRINVYWDRGTLQIRDLRVFDQRYAERYLGRACATAACTWDSLPLVDGLLWSDAATRAVLTPMTTAGPMTGGDPVVEERDGMLVIRWPLMRGGELVMTCRESSLEIFIPASAAKQWWLGLTWAAGAAVPFQAIENRHLHCRHGGHGFTATIAAGDARIDLRQRSLTFTPEIGAAPAEGSIVLAFAASA
jgi:hypothetical protein